MRSWKFDRSVDATEVCAISKKGEIVQLCRDDDIDLIMIIEITHRDEAGYSARFFFNSYNQRKKDSGLLLRSWTTRNRRWCTSVWTPAKRRGENRNDQFCAN